LIESLFKLARLRLARGFSLASLGPNESRILFDFGVAAVAAFVAIAFDALFISRQWQAAYLADIALPLAFVLANTALGLYTTQKMAAARVKALLLLISVVLVGTVWLLLTRDPATAVLWAAVVAGPVISARILVGLPYSRHKGLKAVALANPHGPVLLIGGAGYIGSHAVDLLLAQGRKVRVLDRLMYGVDPLREFLNHPNFELIEGDVTDISKLTLAMSGASAVVHLAGLVGDPACAVDSEFTRQTNIVATRMAKDVAQSLGVRRFVFASSCSVYGITDKEVNELGDLNPVSLYAQTKIDSEHELLYSVRDEFFITILRFATVFGDSRRPRFDLVGNLFTAQAMTNGLITVIGPNQWRPFIHVRDLGRAIVAVLNARAEVVQGQVFNVGDKRLNMTILQLAEGVKAVCSKYRDVQISVRHDVDDRRNYAVSFEKIKNELGFEAQTLLEEGIDQIAQKFFNGTYKDYRLPVYSNVATTKQLLEDFYDPSEMSKLYAPLTMAGRARA
jgi:nucleoside-diphosphate-sugar epimerase